MFKHETLNVYSEFPNDPTLSNRNNPLSHFIFL